MESTSETGNSVEPWDRLRGGQPLSIMWRETAQALGLCKTLAFRVSEGSKLGRRGALQWVARSKGPGCRVTPRPSIVKGLAKRRAVKAGDSGAA